MARDKPSSEELNRHGMTTEQFYDLVNETEQDQKEPCETCQRAHDPNKPCGTQM